jgi:hypothetical protein
MVFSPQSDGVPEGCDSGDRHGQPIALNDPQRQKRYSDQQPGDDQ